jgi:hypothetical protein
VCVFIWHVDTFDFWLHIFLFFIRFIAKCGANVEDLGKPDFVSKISNIVATTGKLVSVICS